MPLSKSGRLFSPCNILGYAWVIVYLFFSVPLPRRGYPIVNIFEVLKAKVVNVWFSIQEGLKKRCPDHKYSDKSIVFLFSVLNNKKKYIFVHLLYIEFSHKNYIRVQKFKVKGYLDIKNIFFYPSQIDQKLRIGPGKTIPPLVNPLPPPNTADMYCIA